MSRINLVTGNVLDVLTPAMRKSSSIYMMTSFVMESGVRALSKAMQDALTHGAEIKMLTGDYLYVTQPKALRSLLSIYDQIEIRLWRSKGVSFHPKAYLMQQRDGAGLLIVGSSNLSRSALQNGVEWNLAMEAAAEPLTFQDALDKFMKSFYHENTVAINKETIELYEEEYNRQHKKNPLLVSAFTEREEIDLMLPIVETKVDEATEDAEVPVVLSITPRAAQVEALEELDKTIHEGYDKAMVVMATGLGKTYLAGFFAQKFKRVLFVAHREEILLQAQQSFQRIMPERTFGIYNGARKEAEADCIFASIYTIGIKEHREKFAPDAFDLIVVDEFHHAAAVSYQRLLEHFKPSFLLGITATPDRLDGKDVYSICDGNVTYQLHFMEAIQKGWLAPFRYHGVYDEIDYTKITWLGSRYDEEELLASQLEERVAEKAFKAWQRHKQTRTLAFCSSIHQANFLTDYFRRQGYAAVSLHSQSKEISRTDAIRLLGSGEIQVIFTVDLFNEGVDIPAVDTLLFVRPTESLTIFTQQIGRGLRLHPGKEHCAIIDLIGNYRNADVKLRVFDLKDSEWEPEKIAAGILPPIAENCLLELEDEVIDLLTEMARKRSPRKERLRNAYVEVKQELGRRPTYLELHLRGKADSRQYKQEYRSLPRFLYQIGELNATEEDAFRHHEKWFQEVESTSMSKSYKMVVLLYMLERGADCWLEPVTPHEVAPFFHRYLTEKEYRKRIDFSDKASRQLWTYNPEKVSKLIADMPMTKWSGSSKDLITFENNQFQICIDVLPEHNPIVYEWTKLICLYRLHQHFERRERGDQH